MWENPTILFTMDDIPLRDKEYAVHPGLHIERATAKEATGFLFYGYRPRLDPQQPGYGHYLVKRPITLKLGDSGDADSLKKKLAGTKWVNSNKVSFEWTTDGRFLHKGVEREWKVLDGNRVQIVFGPDHKDTLVFNESLTEFKQLIRGGSDSFRGTRTSSPSR
jgi:hypothetical protein